MGSICIIAPHQDDEILACSLSIQKALDNGQKVYVFFITNGDYEGLNCAKIRARESLDVLCRIGVNYENIFFFGYGNTGMKKEQCILYELFYSKNEELVPSNVSSYTYHPLQKETFHLQCFGVEAPYVRQSLIQDIRFFLDKYRPDKIYCPSYLDRHGDHIATEPMSILWTKKVERLCHFF